MVYVFATLTQQKDRVGHKWELDSSTRTETFGTDKTLLCVLDSLGKEGWSVASSLPASKPDELKFLLQRQV